MHAPWRRPIRSSPSTNHAPPPLPATRTRRRRCFPPLLLHPLTVQAAAAAAMVARVPRAISTFASSHRLRWRYEQAAVGRQRRRSRRAPDSSMQSQRCHHWIHGLVQRTTRCGCRATDDGLHLERCVASLPKLARPRELALRVRTHSQLLHMVAGSRERCTTSQSSCRSTRRTNCVSV